MFVRGEKVDNLANVGQPECQTRRMIVARRYQRHLPSKEIVMNLQYSNNSHLNILATLINISWSLAALTSGINSGLYKVLALNLLINLIRCINC